MAATYVLHDSLLPGDEITSTRHHLPGGRFHRACLGGGGGKGDTYFMSRRRNGNAHLLGVRPVHDHVTGYLAAVERDVHALAGHQPEVGQRFEAWAHQFGGPVLAPAHGAVVEPHRVTDVDAVTGRLDRSYDAGAQLAVVTARRAHARTDDGPFGQPLPGTRGRARVPLPHPDRRRRSVQLDGGRQRWRRRRIETPNIITSQAEHGSTGGDDHCLFVVNA